MTYPEKETDRPREKGRTLVGKYFTFLLIVALIFSSFYFGYSQGKEEAGNGSNSLPLTSSTISDQSSGEAGLDFSLFWKVWDLLKDKYLERQDLDARELMYGAIKGMLRATGDPYTNFFDPKETKSFDEDISGSFEGIGAELGVKDGVLTIVAPLEDSPAQKAGLKAGDKIIKIGDQITSDISIEKAIELIRGEKGTQVTLTIFREGEESTQDIVITRDRIELKSVSLEFRDDNIAYLKINDFGENTTKEFREAANEVISEETRGIILDLRNNPGGFVDKCVDVASFFLSKNNVVVIEEDSGGKRNELRTQGGDRLSGIPLVVLINEGSASASEILAGALRDDRNITLIGKRSFGKGSVQEYSKLPGGTSVKITVARWLTPNGSSIMDEGISPDIEVEYTLDDFNSQRDPQFDKALEKIKELSR